MQATLEWADDVSMPGGATIEKIHPSFRKPLADFSTERLAITIHQFAKKA